MKGTIVLLAVPVFCICMTVMVDIIWNQIIPEKWKEKLRNDTI